MMAKCSTAGNEFLAVRNSARIAKMNRTRRNNMDTSILEGKLKELNEAVNKTDDAAEKLRLILETYRIEEFLARIDS